MSVVTVDREALINLKVRGQDGNEVLFRMKKNSRLKKLLRAYCHQQSVELNSISFLFYGRRLRGHETPHELRMVDGDNIVAVHQIRAPTTPPVVACYCQREALVRPYWRGLNFGRRLYCCPLHRSDSGFLGRVDRLLELDVLDLKSKVRFLESEIEMKNFIILLLSFALAVFLIIKVKEGSKMESSIS